MSNRTLVAPQLAIVLVAWMFIVGLHWQNDGLWFQGDAPRHAANGLFWKEFLLSGSLNPLDYALRYYARYPVISPTGYPPLFYILEGTLFAASHVSPYPAKSMVLAFALLAACYLMAWLRRWVAIEAGWAAALLLLMPGFVMWSNAVMLNVPATAVSLAALYHARCWIEAPTGPAGKRQLYLAAGFSLAATLIYFPAGITVFVIVAWALSSHRWTLLWDCRTLCVAMAAAAVLLPFLYVAFKWAPIHRSSVTIGLQGVGTASIWSFYAKRLPGLTGFFILTVSLVGLTVGIVYRRWRQESFTLLLFLLVTYVALSLMVERESRYGLLFCVPIASFFAVAVQAFAEWLGKRLNGGKKTSNTTALVLVITICAAQASLAAKTHVPRVQGIREVATFLERLAPNEPFFYDGYYNNVFTFYVQAGDPGYQRRVVLGSKLLYASAMNPTWHYRSYVSTSEDVVEALQGRGGCRWLAIEISKPAAQVPAAVLLRQAVQGPEFELVRSFPASGPGLDRIDVYRFKLDPRPIDETDLPFPILGDGIRFKARPIQR